MNAICCSVNVDRTMVLLRGGGNTSTPYAVIVLFVLRSDGDTKRLPLLTSQQPLPQPPTLQRWLYSELVGTHQPCKGLHPLHPEGGGNIQVPFHIL